MNTSTLFDKYNINGPRYTSYPTAVELHQGISYLDFRAHADAHPERNLSLYIHIPFCHQLCYYCGCNKQVTRQHHKADEYLQMLTKEIEQQAPLFSKRKVAQIHLGGGTPTFMSPAQLADLMMLLNRHFNIEENAEVSIEIDPRSIEVEALTELRKAGFNRISIGVQDFDLKVQKAINRIQDKAHIKALIAQAKALGFDSINLDLVYGLPFQTSISFADTVSQVIELQPDRLSLFSYAHMPERFAAQRKIPEHALPPASEKLQIFLDASAQLEQAGYACIGIDHFAKESDPLLKAQENGELHRNFQGYTTRGDCDLLGLGVSAISQVGGLISQNERQISNYYLGVNLQGHALCKGYELSRDDQIRAALIRQLICHFTLDMQAFEKRWGIKFSTYFDQELTRMVSFVEDGLVCLHQGKLEVLPKGKIFIRAICQSFDRFAHKYRNSNKFSKVI